MKGDRGEVMGRRGEGGVEGRGGQGREEWGVYLYL